MQYRQYRGEASALNSTNTPKRNKVLMGVTFTKKASIRTLNTSDKHTQQYRGSAHSIQHLHHSSSVQNVEAYPESPLKKAGDDELFGRSTAKIQRIKAGSLSPNIDAELNDILALINSQKLRVRERLAKLQRDNAYFRRLCEGKVQKMHTAVNTEDFLSDGEEPERIDKETQCNLADAAANKRKQAYGKLVTMLRDMNINPSNILPEEYFPHDKVEQKGFKALSDGEIIKIQQFFIKKLAAKLPKLL